MPNDSLPELAKIANDIRQDIIKWYATLAHAGFFPKTELDYRELPGVENTGGPLGQGLSQAIGQALAAGKIPFISSYAVFSPGRSWDQLRVSVCYSKRK